MSKHRPQPACVIASSTDDGRIIYYAPFNNPGKWDSRSVFAKRYPNRRIANTGLEELRKWNATQPTGAKMLYLDKAAVYSV